MSRAPLTILLTTFNNGESIRELLASLGWADQLVVVDSFSSDNTVAICREYTPDVWQHYYVNPAKQKNWAIPQCAHEWILILDSDEQVPPALRDEICALLAALDPAYDAYRIARKTLCLGKWVKEMRMWPDYQTRLFRRDRGRYEDKEVHEHLRVPGRIGALSEPLVHNATPELSKQIGVLDRYSRYKAAELARKGRRFRWPDLLLRPPAAFLTIYLLQGGFKAGFRGLFIAFHGAAFTFFTYSKLWEKEWQAGLRQ